MSKQTIVITEQPLPIYLRRYHVMRQAAERLVNNGYEDQEATAALIAERAVDVEEALAVFTDYTRRVKISELVRDLSLADARALVRDSENLDEMLAEAVAYNRHVTPGTVITLFQEMLAQPLNPTARATALSILERYENLDTYLWVNHYATKAITEIDPEVFDFFAQEANLAPELRAHIFQRNLMLLKEGKLPFAYQLGTVHLFSFDQDTDLFVEAFPLFEPEVRNMVIKMFMQYADQPAPEDDEAAMYHAAVSMLLFRLAG